MIRFKQGDMVILARPLSGDNRHGIPEQYYGKEYTVHTVRERSYVIQGYSYLWGVMDEMLDPVGGPW